MGVMECDREGCEQIMCRTCIDSCYYVCEECQSEFKDYLSRNNLTPKTEGQITKEFKIFMKTEKDYYREGKEISVDDFFRENKID